MYMHDTRDVQQMGIRLAVYKRELSLRTPAAEYTGVDCPALASHTVCLLGRYWSPSLVLFKSKSGSIFGSRSGRKREREGRNFLAVCNWMWHGFKRLCLICWGFFSPLSWYHWIQRKCYEVKYHRYVEVYIHLSFDSVDLIGLWVK